MPTNMPSPRNDSPLRKARRRQVEARRVERRQVEDKVELHAAQLQAEARADRAARAALQVDLRLRIQTLPKCCSRLASRFMMAICTLAILTVLSVTNTHQAIRRHQVPRKNCAT